MSDITEQQKNADRELFLHYKNMIIKEFGKEAMDSDQCDHIGKKYFGSRWGGCLPWNNVHVRPNHFYIVNTSSSRGPGIHWMALAVLGKTAYLWDSYNRSVNRLVPHLIRSILKSGFHIALMNHKMDQIGTTSQVCGHESLAWLLTLKKIGIHRASQI